MICCRPFPAEEFAVTVISLAITGTIAAELHVTLTHTKCNLKDKYPELGKSISETQKMLTVLRKNKETAKQSLEQFMSQLQRLCGNFFAVMRPPLKRLNPVKYLNSQELDKDLLYRHKALEKKVLNLKTSSVTPIFK